MPVAALLIGAGLVGLLDSFGRFVVQGLGTPTPLLPTNQLIVTGLYRYVRNPMYVAVLSLICGQTVLFGSAWLALYWVAIWTMFHTSVLVYEEPRLWGDYGDAYDTYCQHVRRWLPRVSPWRGL
ncbi:MAG: methyltransferase family protein [Beijerinckiaceae bacterium]